jgi:hypothetical protein
MYLKVLEKQEQTKLNSLEGNKDQEKINEIAIKRTIQMINEGKRWLFEKISKIVKAMAKVAKRKREKGHISKIRGEKVDTTRDNAEIHKIIGEYFEKLNRKIIAKSRRNE